MKIKIFECGLCGEKEREKMTRHGLRKHLREYHKIVSKLTNSSYKKVILNKNGG